MLSEFLIQLINLTNVKCNFIDDVKSIVYFGGLCGLISKESWTNNQCVFSYKKDRREKQRERNCPVQIIINFFVLQCKQTEFPLIVAAATKLRQY